jgi:hypothetical protein
MKLQEALIVDFPSWTLATSSPATRKGLPAHISIRFFFCSPVPCPMQVYGIEFTLFRFFEDPTRILRGGAASEERERTEAGSLPPHFDPFFIPKTTAYTRRILTSVIPIHGYTGPSLLLLRVQCTHCAKHRPICSCTWSHVPLAQCAKRGVLVRSILAVRENTEVARQMRDNHSYRRSRSVEVSN